MPSPSHPITPEVNTAVTRAIQTDDQLTTAARQLAETAIKRAQHYLDYGSPANQMLVIKAIMPAIGRGLEKRSESEEMAVMRGQLEALQAAMVNGVSGAA